ncbi:hypothetical protein [Catellatospora paridis]|uniref:hypothetical protein n=1 Tax=Catellatospora paridis TaxID=1617086 RepID=UPI0012D44905|nr:hypothetical protein [Catellatospora paridis]
MGTYAKVRGWLECDAQQLAGIRRLITAHPAGYEAGWAFASREFNWTCFAFYGGDIRTGGLEWFDHQLRAMAALPATDDGDRVSGVFVVSVEDQAPVQWLVRDGSVQIVPADPRHGFLDT